MATPLTGNGFATRCWRRLAVGSLIAATGLILIAGCGPPVSDQPALTPPATTSDYDEGPATFSLEPLGPQDCRNWLQALRPVNDDLLDYAASSGSWDGTAPGLGGLEACLIRMRDVPAAAAAELDFVWANLTISSRHQFTQHLPALPYPSTTTDWNDYLADEWQTVLRGELHCSAGWTPADDDLADCDLGGEIDGQLFGFKFAAVHRGVYIAASIDYYTTILSEPVDSQARDHANDLYARFATTVASSLPPE